jgi:hypothetical protein
VADLWQTFYKGLNQDGLPADFFPIWQTFWQHCLAEQSVPIWNSGLTKLQANELEKIQKVALKIILGDGYQSYDTACSKFNIETLSARRLELCTNYAIKLYKSDKSCDFFSHMDNSIETRNERPLLVEQKCNTTRCYNAPHSYLTRLVNQNKARIITSRK